MSRERAFTLSVVTPEGAVLETEAVSVVFPAYDGEYGVLPNHAPLVTLLGIGELRVERADGGKDRFYVDGGFAQFAGDKLSLLTEQARRVEDLDPAAADRLLEEARHLPGGSADATAARQAAFQRAWVQKRLLARAS
jgi:F-type H+-transporting ATPase subunit epsilon